MAARTIHRLSARQVATLKTPGMHADGGGLYLVIDNNGARRWTFVFQWLNKRKEMGLGSFLNVTLADARVKADNARKQVAQGVNPIEARKAARIGPQTFAMAAANYIRAHRKSWKNAKHRRQWVSTLRTHAKHLRPIPIDKVATADILKVLKPLWLTQAETASRLRGRIERILDAARANGLREGENPARWRGHLDHLLPKRQKLQRGHHAALPYDDLPDFLRRLQERKAVAGLALEFTILTASRTSEVLLARWSEVDMIADVWVVPAERMKAGREHRVPLTPRCKEILVDLYVLLEGNDGYIFPGQKKGKPLSNMAMANLLKRMDFDVTVHGFRSTFRDWVFECTDYPREVAEAALAHAIGDETEKAYRRGDALEKRRRLMAAWSEFCTQAPAANVLPFARA